jgi:hypothetical protein
MKPPEKQPPREKPRCCGHCRFYVEALGTCSVHDCERWDNSVPCSQGWAKAQASTEGNDK